MASSSSDMATGNSSNKATESNPEIPQVTNTMPRMHPDDMATLVEQLSASNKRPRSEEATETATMLQEIAERAAIAVLAQSANQPKPVTNTLTSAAERHRIPLSSTLVNEIRTGTDAMDLGKINAADINRNTGYNVDNAAALAAFEVLLNPDAPAPPKRSSSTRITTEAQFWKCLLVYLWHWTFTRIKSDTDDSATTSTPKQLTTYGRDTIRCMEMIDYISVLTSLRGDCSWEAIMYLDTTHRLHAHEHNRSAQSNLEPATSILAGIELTYAHEQAHIEARARLMVDCTAGGKSRRADEASGAGKPGSIFDRIGDIPGNSNGQLQEARHNHLVLPTPPNGEYCKQFFRGGSCQYSQRGGCKWPHICVCYEVDCPTVAQCRSKLPTQQ